MKTDGSFLQFSILTLLGGATIIGFYVGRLVNRINLPTIIGYMALGIIHSKTTSSPAERDFAALKTCRGKAEIPPRMA
jgi:Kef-type K+ transport system membrane component KefB